MQFLVTPDYQTLSREAASIVAEALRLKPALTLGLPAGNTPTGMYEELARLQLDFSKVKTFNIDEYVGLSPADPRSFYAYMTTGISLVRGSAFTFRSTSIPSTFGSFKSRRTTFGWSSIFLTE